MNVKRFDAISILTYFLLSFVAVIVVLHFVFGFQYVVILTNSMEPHINPGDLVISEPVNPATLHKGDVILYKITIGNTTYRITHRIYRVEVSPSGERYFITKGDNRRYPDPWYVHPNQVIGKVVLVIPKVGMIWPYIPLIVLGIFMLVIGMIAYDIAKILFEPPLIRPKSDKADLQALRRKKIKVYYHKRY